VRRLAILAVAIGLVASTVFAVVGSAGAVSAAATAAQPPIYVTTTVALNLRNEPSLSAKVILVLPKGTKVRWTDQVVNGFRYVVYENNQTGTPGWAFDKYLAPVVAEEPAYFTTMAALNLRAQPNGTAAIKLVVPAGATVIDYDLAPLVNGYRGVDYNGTVGWVSDAFLD
jgi:uncharacterized protein YgiM (DUF1202 family)